MRIPKQSLNERIGFGNQNTLFLQQFRKLILVHLSFLKRNEHILVNDN
jgi:hypothetical protein